MATTTIATQKLGKLPVRTDVRTLSLGRYIDVARLPSPPDTFDETTGVPDWPMYANDRIGDCTTAAAAHMIEAWTAAGRGHAVEISERSVLDAFDHVKLVDPASGEEGAIELDVLRYWRTSGIGRHKIGAYARVSVHDHSLVETAAWLFGGLYLGVQLPVTARTQEFEAECTCDQPDVGASERPTGLAGATSRTATSMPPIRPNCQETVVKRR